MPKPKVSKISQQIVLWIVANAGGVGKTTLGIHLGYRLAQLGLNTLFIDLDTNGSLARFCGLECDLESQQTSAALFERNFAGDYPIYRPTWGTPKGKLELCLGGDVMLSVALDLPSRTGREMVLKRVVLQKAVRSWENIFSRKLNTLSMNSKYPFKWRHYQPEVILLCVRWYLRYPLSYRHVEEMMRALGIER